MNVEQSSRFAALVLGRQSDRVEVLHIDLKRVRVVVWQGEPKLSTGSPCAVRNGQASVPLYDQVLAHMRSLSWVANVDDYQFARDRDSELALQPLFVLFT